MSAAGIAIAIVALFSLSCGFLALASVRGRLGVAAVALFALACVVWAFAFAAIGSGYQDADGFATCGEDCSAVQYLSALGFLAPPLLISLAGLAMLVALARRWRGRRATLENPG